VGAKSFWGKRKAITGLAWTLPSVATPRFGVLNISCSASRHAPPRSTTWQKTSRLSPISQLEKTREKVWC
jgi:hypothetical protein